MTAFRTILVPFADPGCAGALEATFRLFPAAHATALHVRIDPTAAVPLVGEGMSGAMVEEMLNAAERQAAERAQAARAAFDQVRARFGVTLQAAPPAAGPTADWLEVAGREEEAVAWRGRLHDLVVTGCPREGAETPSLLTLNAALLESGRPLLLAPTTPPAGPASRIAVAWNGSAEAGRAIAAALPLLATASAVTVLTITEDDRTRGVPAAELETYLAWHGVAAQFRTVTAGAQAGQVLLDECRGADLLVMGAYTHSRLRQMILGGVTRHVLQHAELPVLMSH
ncbi:universal stress protein [Magnetospirillum sp. UT-4]|uniref:universal stress protein n=1 Tax=Magnetospirillum sp. UT-4 TaxID=2681467 RepID=UPI00138562DA|nr:universal stress protein [Magnetospirillum sp. UT-4]CAA7626467.1 Universal stress protein UspA [Magnetospirillum sp. UT-4]